MSDFRGPPTSIEKSDASQVVDEGPDQGNLHADHASCRLDKYGLPLAPQPSVYKDDPLVGEFQTEALQLG
jgi:hypothetical protein